MKLNIAVSFKFSKLAIQKFSCVSNISLKPFYLLDILQKSIEINFPIRFHLCSSV
jgi:hypothetical protein